MKRHKAFEIASFKALPDADGVRGRFEAVVSVFGNVDYQGDRVVKGAFSKSLEKWKKSGDPIPIIWSHDWGDPFAHIGSADPALAEETDQGLKLIGNFDIEKPFAAQVYDLVKTRRVREWSFAYDIEDESIADDKANELRVLDIIEAGPTLKGANPDTQTLGVKAQLESAARKETPSVGTATVKIVADISEFEKQLTEIEERLARIGFARADAAAQEDGTKSRKNVYTYLDGSAEAAAEEMREAVRGWAAANVPDYGNDNTPGPWVGVAGTYPGYVIVEIEPYDADNRYVRLNYTRGEDGAIQFSDPQDVELNVTITAAEKEWLEAELKAWLDAEAALKGTSTDGGKSEIESIRAKLRVLTEG